MHLLVGNPGRHLGADLVDVVLDQGTRHQAMAHLHCAGGQQFTGGIGLEGACITDRQYGNVERHKDRVQFHTHIGRLTKVLYLRAN
ncbi:hypothetical protein D9M71_690480 [compost metagenome]